MKSMSVKINFRLQNPFVNMGQAARTAATLSGVAKSNVRVARVVHLLVWATDFFQLSCPWTTSFLKLGPGIQKNTLY